MTTFKQILAGCMTAGLILGSLPMMGGDLNANKHQQRRLDLLKRQPNKQGLEALSNNQAEGSDAYKAKQREKEEATAPEQPYQFKYKPLVGIDGTFYSGGAAFTTAFFSLFYEQNILSATALLALTCALAYQPYVYGQRLYEEDIQARKNKNYGAAQEFPSSADIFFGLSATTVAVTAYTTLRALIR